MQLFMWHRNQKAVCHWALLSFPLALGLWDSLGFMSRSAKRREQVWKISMCRPAAPSKGQSFAHITIGLAGLVTAI